MMSTKATVLVTGSTGLLGSHLVSMLHKQGYSVVGIADNGNAHNGAVTNEQVDIRDFASVQNIFYAHKPEIVFHTAAFLPREGESHFPYFSTNVLGTLNVLEASRQVGVKKIVYSSSMSIYGKEVDLLPVTEIHISRPYDFYSLTKFQGEEICRLYAQEYSLPCVILRYAGMYGKGRENGVVYSFLQNALEGKPLRVLKNISWDIVYVKDAVKANIASAAHNLEQVCAVYNIGSGKEITTEQLARLFVNKTKSHSEIHVEDKDISFRFAYDISKAGTELGFRPLSIQAGLNDYIREMRKTER